MTIAWTFYPFFVYFYYETVETILQNSFGSIWKVLNLYKKI